MASTRSSGGRYRVGQGARRRSQWAWMRSDECGSEGGWDAWHDLGACTSCLAAQPPCKAKPTSYHTRLPDPSRYYTYLACNHPAASGEQTTTS